MKHANEVNIDEETIRKAGLRETDKPVNAELAPDARVFEFPDLENVFIMESDLYGNTMPKGSCFLAFYGRSGLMGKHLKVESLKNCSVEDIKQIVERNRQG